MNSTTEILEQRLNTGPGPNPTPILENHPTQSAATIDGLRSALFGIPFIAAVSWGRPGRVGVSPLALARPPFRRTHLRPRLFSRGLFLSDLRPCRPPT